MNNEQTSKNTFTHSKIHYGEVILAKIHKLKKTLSFTIFSSLSS